MKMNYNINLIVAIGADDSIGKNGDLIWKISEDLKRFKELTTGHPVIMGRKTWESLPKKPLPGRQNIVMTRNKDFNSPGAVTVNSVEEVLKLLETRSAGIKENGENREINPGNSAFVIGGAEIYELMLPYTSRLYLTRIDDICEDADAFLSLNLERDWEKSEESREFKTPEGISYKYLTYQRK